jgi:fibronectin-binding autotransporter adhesin
MEVTQHSYFRGGLDLNGGTLKVSGGNGGYGFFSGTVNVNSGTTLSISSDGTGFGYQNDWKPTSVNINGGTVSTTGANHVWGISGGVNMTGGTLQSSGGFQWNYTNLNTNASADTATISGPLNLRGDGGYTTMAVSVADGAAATDLLISGNISQLFASMGITKSGAGTMELSGNSSYTGATTVSAGKLVVNGNISTSNTTVQAGATLGGSGTVGAVTVQNNGILAPGNSPGTLTFTGDLTLDAGSISDFEINSFSLGNYDLAVAAAAGTQNVSFNGILNLFFQSGFSTVGSIKIFDFDGYSGAFTSVIPTGLASGFTASFDNATGIVTVVPEPGAALLGGLGMLALLRRRR